KTIAAKSCSPILQSIFRARQHSSENAMLYLVVRVSLKWPNCRDCGQTGFEVTSSAHRLLDVGDCFNSGSRTTCWRSRKPEYPKQEASFRAGHGPSFATRHLRVCRQGLGTFIYSLSPPLQQRRRLGPAEGDIVPTSGATSR